MPAPVMVLHMTHTVGIPEGPLPFPSPIFWSLKGLLGILWSINPKPLSIGKKLGFRQQYDQGILKWLSYKENLKKHGFNTLPMYHAILCVRSFAITIQTMMSTALRLFSKT